MIDTDIICEVAADLRDVPRGCIGDWPEMLVWLRRQARRLESATLAPVSPGTRQVTPKTARPCERRRLIYGKNGRTVQVISTACE